jgi:hypothetical protein
VNSTTREEAAMIDMARQAQEAQRLLQVGRVGHATVVAVRHTGVTINDNPQAELDLHVAVAGLDPYRITHRQVISRIAIGGFQPGVTVPVRVDPQDLHNVLVA